MNEFINGCLVTIFLSIATGHYGDVQKWAAREAAKPMTPLPYFFHRSEKSSPHHSVKYCRTSKQNRLG
jgi:hypothetical protein